MGLDISYQGHLRRVECDGGDDCDHWTVRLNTDFPGRTSGIPFGHFVRDDSHGGHFRAGSYGGYNVWREQLAALVGTTPDAVWNDWEKFAGTPFAELINFSDCGGEIGPDVSRKLADDFAAHDEQAKAAMDGYGYGKYQEWRKAFETAADGGAVFFR